MLKPKAFLRFICMTHFNSRISYFYVGTYKMRVFIEHWNNAGMENSKVYKLTAELSHIKSNRKKEEIRNCSTKERESSGWIQYVFSHLSWLNGKWCWSSYHNTIHITNFITNTLSHSFIHQNIVPILHSFWWLWTNMTNENRWSH